MGDDYGLLRQHNGVQHIHGHTHNEAGATVMINRKCMPINWTNMRCWVASSASPSKYITCLNHISTSYLMDNAFVSQLRFFAQ